MSRRSRTASFRATVVFDGHNNPGSDGRPHTIAGVTVIFSRYGCDADSVIESLSRTAREAGDDVVVVTSDAQTQWTVLGWQCRRGCRRPSSPPRSGPKTPSGATTHRRAARRGGSKIASMQRCATGFRDGRAVRNSQPSSFCCLEYCETVWFGAISVGCGRWGLPHQYLTGVPEFACRAGGEPS